MIKKIVKKIWSSNSHEDVHTPSNEIASFVLMYKEIEIGTLQIKDSIWKFEYSLEFQKQNDLSPIVDFPDKNKAYESEQLWPFFSYRIPGLSQPDVKEILKEEAIDKNNEVALLKKFGKFSVYNPFKLNPTF